MLTMDDVIVKYGILFLLWANYLWGLYLSIRQYKKVYATTELPPELEGVMSKETFDKSRLYMLAKCKFWFVQDAFYIIQSTVVIYFGILSTIWSYSESFIIYGDGASTNCLWLFIVITVQTVVDLPFIIYETFILKGQFGLNKQTRQFFIQDNIKTYCLQQAVNYYVFSRVTNNSTIKFGIGFFIALAILFSMIFLFKQAIYPSLIAPWFNKYIPIPEGELRTQIEDLASRVKFPLTQIYVDEGSKEPSESNVFIYGFFKAKRIVLSNSLLTKDGTYWENEDILAIVSQKLGNWHHSTFKKNLFVFQIKPLVWGLVIIWFFNNPLIYEAFGFYNARPAAAGFWIIVCYIMLPFNSLINMILYNFSRRFEFQADSFVTKLGKGNQLVNALVHLSSDNLEFPVYDSLFSIWYRDRPTLLERVVQITCNKED